MPASPYYSSIKLISELSSDGFDSFIKEHSNRYSYDNRLKKLTLEGKMNQIEKEILLRLFADEDSQHEIIQLLHKSKYPPDRYPHADITSEIISAANYVANGYKNYLLKIDSTPLHHKFRNDICDLLNNRGIHAVPEEFIPRPLRDGLIRNGKVCHFADIMVLDKVLVEIKIRSDANNLGGQKALEFEGQCLNTLEYAELQVMSLLKMQNNGKYFVQPNRFVL
jgi:hypothetical protein